MSIIKLRDYQNKLVADLRYEFANGKKKLLAVSPVGSGKTVLFSYMTKNAFDKGLKVLILAHREELLFQIAEALDMFNCDYSYIMPDEPFLKKQVQVGSVMTVLNRLEKIDDPDLIVIDEAHHLASGNSWSKIINHYKNAKVVGVTASPIRLDGKPLKDSFDSMVIGPSVKDLIKSGSLCDYKAYAPSLVDTSKLKKSMGDYVKNDISELMDKPSITGNAVAEWIKLAKGKRTVVFCVSVKHSENVAAEYNKNGIPAESIDGKMNKYDRRKIVEDFKSGKIEVLTNVNITTEGFNLPSIECVQFLRPTASESLAIQMAGRGLRIMENKPYAILIDHVNIFLKHGLPDEDKEWSLEVGSKKKKTKGSNAIQNIKICTECFAANNSFAKNCYNCGHEFEVKSRGGPEVKDGELTEIDKTKFKKQAKLEQARAETMEQLVELGKKRGYKKAKQWAFMIFNSRRRRRK